MNRRWITSGFTVLIAGVFFALAGCTSQPPEANLPGYRLSYGKIQDEQQAKAAAIDFSKCDADAVAFTDSQAVTDSAGDTLYQLKFTSGDGSYQFQIRAADGQVLDYRFVGTLPDAGEDVGQTYAVQLLAGMIPGVNQDGVGAAMKLDQQNSDGLPVYKGKVLVHGNQYKYEIHTLTGKLVQWSLKQ